MYCVDRLRIWVYTTSHWRHLEAVSSFLFYVFYFVSCWWLFSQASYVNKWTANLMSCRHTSESSAWQSDTAAESGVFFEGDFDSSPVKKVCLEITLKNTDVCTVANVCWQRVPDRWTSHWKRPFTELGDSRWNCIWKCAQSPTKNNDLASLQYGTDFFLLLDSWMCVSGIRCYCSW